MNNRRHFLVSVWLTPDIGHPFVATLPITSDGAYPSIFHIREITSQNYPEAEDMAVISIMEIEQDDFLDFMRESPPDQIDFDELI